MSTSPIAYCSWTWPLPPILNSPRCVLKISLSSSVTVVWLLSVQTWQALTVTLESSTTWIPSALLLVHHCHHASCMNPLLTLLRILSHKRHRGTRGRAWNPIGGMSLAHNGDRWGALCVIHWTELEQNWTWHCSSKCVVTGTTWYSQFPLDEEKLHQEGKY